MILVVRKRCFHVGVLQNTQNSIQLGEKSLIVAQNTQKSQNQLYCKFIICTSHVCSFILCEAKNIVYSNLKSSDYSSLLLCDAFKFAVSPGDDEKSNFDPSFI